MTKDWMEPASSATRRKPDDDGRQRAVAPAQCPIPHDVQEMGTPLP